MIEFREFPKIARWSRDVVITEKIDGTNACVVVSDDGKEIAAQSRNRIITPESDNFGFARWVYENKEALLQLGPGHHFGEWWGAGIQRGYGLDHKRFSLFPARRLVTPSVCHTVPVLYEGPLWCRDLADFSSRYIIHECLDMLRDDGSVAAPGFMDPEGIIIYHTASRTLYKKTIKDDGVPKGTVQPTNGS